MQGRVDLKGTYSLHKLYKTNIIVMALYILSALGQSLVLAANWSPYLRMTRS